MQENKEALQNLEDNLNDLGLTLKTIPWVIQYNKRDLPGRIEREIMDQELNPDAVPSFEAVASKGGGVYETFAGIAKLVFKNMQEELKDPDRKRDVREPRNRERLNIEVVAKGSLKSNAAAEAGDYRNGAGKKEEEPASVSEFVDSVLKDRVDPQSIDLGATREGYEEYGHLVDLNGADAKEQEASPQPAKPGEILSDSVEKLKAKVALQEAEAPPKAEPRPRLDVVEEKLIRVPVRLSREEAAKEIHLSIIIDIAVD
jgi:hypothetical protein